MTARWPIACRTMLVLCVLLALAGCERSGEAFNAEDVAANNRGVALMGYFDYSAARDTFDALVQRRPGWHDARLNLAVATLNRQQEGDEQRALAIVDTVLQEDPENLRASYIAGLLYLYLGETEAALARFNTVTSGDPDDAYAAYFSGQALVQQGDLAAAADAYARAIELDPYLRSAYYGAALVLRRLDQPEQAREMLAVYERFRDNPRARLAEFKYTRLGPKAAALAIGREQAALATPPSGDLFGAPLIIGPALGTQVRSLTTADADNDGVQDLFLVTATDTRLLTGTADGSYTESAGHPLAGITDGHAALWGDVDNDGAADLYLCRRGANQLWLAETDGAWREAGASTGVADTGDCVDGGMVDADHDGDLDIFVVNGDGPDELFSNNGDGSFRRLGANQGIAGAASGRQFLAADLDNDRDLDLLVINQGGGNAVWANDRLWQYRAAEGFDDFRATALLAVTIADMDADGRPEIHGVSEDGRLLSWRRQPDGWKQAQHGAVDGNNPQLTAADFDGDGRLEMLVASSEEISIRDASGAITVVVDEPGPLGPALVLNADVTAGPELVAAAADALRRWPAGPGRLPFLGLSLSGKEDQADSMRSNQSGIGARVSLRLLDRWTITSTLERDSAPGQSLQPLFMGLGGQPNADYVAIDWSDGVFQTELDLGAARLHRIAETQRQLSSCPVIFAWDGEQYRFISDVLGVGGLGFLVEPGVYAEPRPWEYFLMPRDSLAPKDGRYVIKIAEPMEENLYLDAAGLHAFDLPPGWDMVNDERMATGAPDVTGRPIFFREDLNPIAANNERGETVLDAVIAGDHRAAPVGALDKRFIGLLAAEHQLTLEFGRVINPPGSKPVLVVDGWVEYPYSQTIFAAWQAGLIYKAASLDARTADGEWQRAYPGFGYPAGMPREMALPLANLPADTVALRLVTNQEIYWDRVRVVMEESPPPELIHTVMAPVSARLAKTGFARRSTAAQRLPYYDYALRDAFWDARYLDGFYTRLGPVDALIASADDAVAIIGSGEEVELGFDAPAAVAPGWTRRFVLEARGWAKDMDLYTRDGGQVGPLPRRIQGDPSMDARRQALHERYNVRFQSGR